MAFGFTEFNLANTGETLKLAVFPAGGFYVQSNTDATTFIFFGIQQVEVEGSYTTVRDAIAAV